MAKKKRVNYFGRLRLTRVKKGKEHSTKNKTVKSFSIL
jgi:hypothetical protein